MTRLASRLLWWALAAAATFGLGWWLAPPIAVPSSSMVAAADRWISPKVPRSSDQLQLATNVGVSPMWGSVGVGPPAAAAPAPPAPAWWIAGTYGAEATRMALVRFGDPSLPPLKVAVGGQLPSGHRVVAIREADVCIRIGDANYTLGVERRER